MTRLNLDKMEQTEAQIKNSKCQMDGKTNGKKVETNKSMDHTGKQHLLKPGQYEPH